MRGRFERWVVGLMVRAIREAQPQKDYVVSVDGAQIVRAIRKNRGTGGVKASA